MKHLKLPDMLPEQVYPNHPYTEYELIYHGGINRKILVVDEEIPYPDGRMIVSRTDVNGIITEANQAFVDISHYDREELIGSPHCILRHPDVPAVIFKDAWTTLSSGKTWFGYVKNLAKDGRYYWVYASIMPNFRDGQLVALTSVRRKPSRTKIAETLELIGKINSGEIVL
ncbi:hypothetical protein AwWohl_09850 [Gammaproteobacteria bacterium]|nr:hypothetical protein AwWohl_09850 [Gammaproteobacteria bacterium]